jgi:hypothetical protein
MVVDVASRIDQRLQGRAVGDPVVLDREPAQVGQTGQVGELRVAEGVAVEVQPLEGGESGERREAAHLVVDQAQATQLGHARQGRHVLDLVLPQLKVPDLRQGSQRRDVFDRVLEQREVREGGRVLESRQRHDPHVLALEEEKLSQVLGEDVSVGAVQGGANALLQVGVGEGHRPHVHVGLYVLAACIFRLPGGTSVACRARGTSSSSSTARTARGAAAAPRASVLGVVRTGRAHDPE